MVVDKLFFSENADKLKEDLLKNNPYYKEVNNLFPKNDYSYSFAIDLINSRKQEWTETSFLDALKKLNEDEVARLRYKNSELFEKLFKPYITLELMKAVIEKNNSKTY